MEKVSLNSLYDWAAWVVQKNIDPAFLPQPESFPCVALFKLLRPVELATTTDVVIEYVYKTEFKP